jgi:hypothetical protein
LRKHSLRIYKEFLQINNKNQLGGWGGEEVVKTLPLISASFSPLINPLKSWTNLFSVYFKKQMIFIHFLGIGPQAQITFLMQLYM